MKRRELSHVLEELESAKFFKSCRMAKVEQKARPGCFRDFPSDLPDTLRTVLTEKDITRLYSHQEESYRAASDGRDLVIVTPTASGKTLCYNLPVLSAILRDPTKRALYLFPTKALAQDQRAELQSLIAGTGVDIKTYTYDGDTPSDVRGMIRKRGNIVITNPDMLHAGILPHHTKWNEFLGNLSFLVIDEMHTYRGVFGSHMVNVLRRLSRVCGHYGTRPQITLCSATIANPKELAIRLIGGDVHLIENSGAPVARKNIYFVNPPVLRKEIGLRQSPLTMTQKIAHHFLRNGNSTIVFTTTRLNVEILTKYLKDLLLKSGPEEERKIRGYRGGYLPNVRREIERGLREGEIKGVVSTNALELGVDIGSLEACVICGYPGSIASTWQQAGRAGRRTGLACTVLVARSTPLDQFIVQHPDYFFGRSPEHARLNPDNLSIFVSHVQCAAFELPFRKGEAFGVPELEEILDYLAEKQVLRKLGDRWYWAQDAYPADAVSLRSVTAENFLVVDRSSGNRILAEVDYESAPLTLYPGAVYMLESQQYQVEELDYGNKKAYVTPLKAEYYTEAVLYTKLKILQVFVSDPETRRGGRPEFNEGEVHVVNHVAGFKKLKFYTSENLGYGDVSLPDQEMHTSAFWITVHPEDIHDMGLSVQDLLCSLAGAGYAMQHMASFLLMCESRDLGRVIGDPYMEWFFQAEADLGKLKNMTQKVQESVEQIGLRAEGMEFRPTLFLYDSYPGGVGLSSSLFSKRMELIEGTLALIDGCSCKKGCPSCVGPSPELGEMARAGASRLLRWMIYGSD